MNHNMTEYIWFRALTALLTHSLQRWVFWNAAKGRFGLTWWWVPQNIPTKLFVMIPAGQQGHCPARYNSVTHKFAWVPLFSSRFGRITHCYIHGATLPCFLTLKLQEALLSLIWTRFRCKELDDEKTNSKVPYLLFENLKQRGPAQ